LREQLVGKKIDLNKNLFIILQGEVERLCELSPEMMVEYLEYVSGLDELKEPIDAAEKRYMGIEMEK
jgi:chromosome segregation ATPase